MILYILLSGVPPFWGESEQQIFDAILKGNLDFQSEPWPQISSEAKDCVKQMLQQVRSAIVPAAASHCMQGSFSNALDLSRSLCAYSALLYKTRFQAVVTRLFVLHESLPSQ